MRRSIRRGGEQLVPLLLVYRITSNQSKHTAQCAQGRGQGRDDIYPYTNVLLFLSSSRLPVSPSLFSLLSYTYLSFLFQVPVELLISSSLGGLNVYERLLLSTVATYQNTREKACPRHVLAGVLPHRDDDAFVSICIDECVHRGLILQVGPQQYAYCNG